MPLIEQGQNVASFEPGNDVESHFHDYDELWFILEGRGRAILVESGRRRDIEIAKGDIVVTVAGDEHALVPTEKLTLVWVPGTIPPGARMGHLHMPDDAPAHRLILSD